MRRKGYTPDAINDFCKRIGTSIGVSSTLLNYELLEECLRQDLENKAPRVMAIMNPLKLNILNINENEKHIINALDFPNLGQNSTTHLINAGNIVFIDKEDFRMIDSPNYFRLAPGKIVRLKYFGLIKYESAVKDDSDNIIEVNVSLLPNDFKPEKRVKGTLNWISNIDHIVVKINIYDHLFPTKIINESDWKTELNMHSKKSINIMADSSIKNAKIYDKFQFERIGYFSVDPATNSDEIVLNMITKLKEDKNK